MHSFARKVTNPRSPGPAPTRQTVPFCFVLFVMLLLLRDPSQQFAGQLPAFVANAFHFGLPWRRRFTQENLRAHFHLAVLNLCKHADRTIAIALQTTQKFSLRLQTKQRFAIVYDIDKRLCALITDPYLEGDYSLTARRQKNFARKNLKKKLPAFKADFGATWRQ